MDLNCLIRRLSRFLVRLGVSWFFNGRTTMLTRCCSLFLLLPFSYLNRHTTTSPRALSKKMPRFAPCSPHTPIELLTSLHSLPLDVPHPLCFCSCYLADVLSLFFFCVEMSTKYIFRFAPTASGVSLKRRLSTVTVFRASIHSEFI